MIWLFSYACILTLTLAYTFPSLIFFAPFLILSFYKCRQLTCLWWALVCGLVIDLLCSHSRFGIHALNYCLITQLLYPQQRHFFVDHLTTLPLMTFFFAILSTFLHVLLSYIFGEEIQLSSEWLKHHLFLFAIHNSFYAVLAFTIPSFLLPKLRRQRHLYHA